MTALKDAHQHLKVEMFFDVKHEHILKLGHARPCVSYMHHP